MTLGGYMSTVQGFKAYNTQLSRDQLHLLARFVSRRSFSTYDLFKSLRISYKNVHKKVQRLLALDLIQKKPGVWRRDAKHYELTAQGLYYLFLNFSHISHWIVLNAASILSNYAGDILWATFLYPYIKLKTIKQIENIHFLFDIFNYLHECCTLVNQALSRWDVDTNTGRKITHREALLGILEYRTNALLFSLILEFISSRKGSELSDKERTILRLDDHFVKVTRELYQKFTLSYKNLSID